MIENVRLDLSGLKSIMIAMLLNVLSLVVSGFTGSETLSSIDSGGSALSTILSLAVSVASIASLVLTISGLGKLMRYSLFFQKSRKYYIINLVLSIGLVVIAVISVIGLGVSAFTNGGGVSDQVAAIWVILLLLLALAVAVASVVLQILYVRNLCFGCQELAIAAGEAALSQRLHKMERLYRIGTILATVMVVLAVIFFLGSLIKIGIQLSQTSGLDIASLFFCVILLLVGAILSLVIWIKLLLRVRETYNSLNGREVSASRSQEGLRLLAPAQAARQTTPAPEASAARTSTDLESTPEAATAAADAEAPQTPQASSGPVSYTIHADELAEAGAAETPTADAGDAADLAAATTGDAATADPSASEDATPSTAGKTAEASDSAGALPVEQAAPPAEDADTQAPQ